MKFVTFRLSGVVRAGVVACDRGEDEIVDLAHPSMAGALCGLEPQISAFLAFGLAEVSNNIRSHGLSLSARLPMRGVELMAPLPRPKRIFGVAHNYSDALAERGMAAPAEPVLFRKGIETVIAPNEAIILPSGIGGVTYEAELAVFIGRRADCIDKARALAYVAGYSVFNDITASEVIRQDGNYDRGKNYDTFGPFGALFVTSDEVTDPQALRVSLSVDGKILQDGSTRDMVFSVADLVSYLSHRQPLEPGDIIATGTPAGVASMHRPRAWLRPGSLVQVSIEKLGSLDNPVVATAL